MAIVSGTLGTIAGVSKLLAGGMTKKKLMKGAGNMLKDKASGAVKNRLGRRKKKDGPGGPGEEEGGSIVQSSAGAIVPTSPLMGDIVTSYPTEPAKVKAKPTGVVNYKTITEQFESIVALTAAIEQVTGKSVKSKKEISETNRKNKEKDAKRAKEEGKENLVGGALGFLGQKASEVGQKYGIFNFLSNILAGFVLVKLLPMVPGILNGLQFAGNNLHLFFLGFKGLGETIRLGTKSLKKELPKITKNLGKIIDPVKNAFTKAGTKIKNLLKGLGNIVPKFITRGLDRVADAARGVAEGAKNLGRVVRGKGAAQLGKGAAQLGKGIQAGKGLLGKTFGARSKFATTRVGNFLALTAFDTKLAVKPILRNVGKNVSEFLGTGERLRRLPVGSGKMTNTLSKYALQIRAKHGDEAARMFQGLIDNGVKPQRALQNVNKAISSGKLTSTPLMGSLGGGIKGSQLFKGGANKSLNRGLLKTFGKNNKLVKGIVKSGGLLATKSGMSRIPIIGPLIVAVTTYFEDADGDGQADKKLDKALFKAGGTLLGGFLGTWFPIPILGTILGELIGEYVGELFYILLKGGGIGEVGKKLQQDIVAVLKTGQKVLGWAGDGFKRMYEGIPKFKIPEWVPSWMLGPLELLLNSGGMSLKNIAIPNPFWMANPFNAKEKFGIVTKAFFSRDPMTPGEVKDSTDEPEGPRDTSNDINQKIDKNYGLKVGDEVTFTTSTGMEVKAYKTTNGFDFYKKGFLGMGDQKLDFSDGKNSWIVDEFEQFQQSKNTDSPPDATPSPAIMVKPDRKDYKGRGGAANYAKDMEAYSKQEESNKVEQQPEKVTNPEVKPSTPMTGDLKPEEKEEPQVQPSTPIAGDMKPKTPDVSDLSSKSDAELKDMLDPTMMGAKNPDIFNAAKQTRADAKEEGLTPEQTERKVLEATVQATHGNKQSEDVTPEASTPPSSPEITPQKQPVSTATPVQRQASYDQPGGAPTPMVLPPKQKPQRSGGGGGGTALPVGSGNVLNSYYKAQLFGFLYKQG